MGTPEDDATPMNRATPEDVALLRKAADLGIVEAQRGLGLCYYYGNGVEQNYVKAIYWYKKVAKQGHDDAYSILGLAYLHGIGVKRDKLKAVKWFRKAARQGEASAQDELRKLNTTW